MLELAEGLDPRPSDYKFEGGGFIVSMGFQNATGYEE